MGFRAPLLVKRCIYYAILFCFFSFAFITTPLGIANTRNPPQASFYEQNGASVVHFQDLGAEFVRCTTIPNVPANLQQAHDKKSRQPEGPHIPSRQIISPIVNFYAGKWEELATILWLSRVIYQNYQKQQTSVSLRRILWMDVVVMMEASLDIKFIQGNQESFQEVGFGSGLMKRIMKKVGATNTFISPFECILLQNQFIRETEDTITQTLASQGRTKGYMEQNVYSYVYDDC
nr:histidine protein methyltransferase 1 homolog [Tanacetum cinerariifolium]